MSKETGREWEHKKYSISAQFEKNDFFGYFDAYPDILAEISIYQINEGTCYVVENRLRDFSTLERGRESMEKTGLALGLSDGVKHILEDEFQWFMGRHAKDQAHEYALEVMSGYAKTFGNMDLNIDDLFDDLE